MSPYGMTWFHRRYPKEYNKQWRADNAHLKEVYNKYWYEVDSERRKRNVRIMRLFRTLESGLPDELTKEGGLDEYKGFA